MPVRRLFGKDLQILDYTVITSTYGRRVNNIQNFIDKSDAYYLNQNKSRTEKWLQALRLHLPSAITIFGSVKRIPNFEAEVNGNTLESSRNRISQKTKDAVAACKAQRDAVDKLGRRIPTENIATKKQDCYEGEYHFWRYQICSPRLLLS